MGKIVRDETLEMINHTLSEINKTLGGASSGGTVYGFHINSKAANPSDRVTYLRDAVGMIPAKMDYENDVFNYGTWGSAFFIPKPCMLKYDGKVDYYLDENDFTKKEDGTPSDVANTSYEGNAMVEFPKIWIKIIADRNDPTSSEVYIADHKADEDFKDWCYINQEGNHVNKFYKPIYAGGEVGSKIRSLSGLHPSINRNAQTQRDYIQNNGAGWDMESYSETILLWCLLILMGKSTDVQSVFGNGNMDGYDVNTPPYYGMLDSGAMNAKGMFWGSNAINRGVKVFGIENYWANQYRRELGLINDHGVYKVKLAYGMEDGSLDDDYNMTGVGYIESDVLVPASGYLKEVNFSDGTMLMQTTSGGSTTYYCDYFYSNNTQINVCLRGGYCAYGLYCGFCFYLNNAASAAYWIIGASPSYRQLV